MAEVLERIMNEMFLGARDGSGGGGRRGGEMIL